MMNKLTKIGLLVLVLVMLTACGANAADGGDVDSGSAVSPSESEIAAASSGEDGDSEVKPRDQLRSDTGDNALSPVTQMLLGTFLLEETEFSVDVEQASNLVLYWKLYKALLESDTTAPEELDAVVTEIQDVMTGEQLDTIASLELIQEDLMTYATESGILESLRPEGAEGGDGTRQDRPEGFGGGQGRGQGTNLEGLDPEVAATLQAQRDEMGGSGGIASRLEIPMIEALIEMLEGKLES